MMRGPEKNPINFGVDPGIFTTLFSIVKQGFVDIFISLSGNNVWIVMLKKSDTYMICEFVQFGADTR